MLSLKVATDAAWVETAIADLDRVLADHAHCEMKAASNALSLATRHPDNVGLVRALAAIAREEILHFESVLAMLQARGIPLGPPPVDEYAAALRHAVSAESGGPKLGALVDRLLVGALIEARSCERFKLLAERLARDGEEHRELGAFYETLFVAEARHHREFVDLAVEAAGGDRNAVIQRLDRLADREAAIVGACADAPDRATIHG
jgi:tRNA-(ms[2]io[6]A)-hydroxylase